MFRVVLTGGIASGKSAASAHFEALGIAVIDADQVSRELVQPGQPALQQIANHFGPQLLRQDGSLDRARLRGKIFADPQQRLVLEDILHPLIQQRMQELADKADSPYVVMVVPLLLESRQQYQHERVLLIDVPEDLQRDRLMARDGSDAGQVEQILAAQAGRDQRLAIADDIIRNNGNLQQLHAAVDGLHLRYLNLSQPG